MTFEQLLKHFWIIENCGRDSKEESKDSLDYECPEIEPLCEELQESNIEKD